METTGPWASTLVHADEAVPGRWHAHVDDIWTASHHKARIAADGYASIETLLWDLDGDGDASSAGDRGVSPGGDRGVSPGGGRGVGVGGEAAEPQLVAYATQQMFFAFPDGPPPPDQLRL